jgi:hypothetical protein
MGFQKVDVDSEKELEYIYTKLIWYLYRYFSNGDDTWLDEEI